ncbi:Fmp10p ASCRUDRAFT_7400 [Ascoidea rubescens DSM 1968]|uniref:Thioesterase domain-containing protein n=1 Tax=Ascoidea rubescens DSM 1968 TaxID=1344418 RepID=A0A1D2VJY8_9ASCO|nr:hypothetical protein ASCRUDRAFT_7400 [Ascoidea rubescens DSM 1968]ODV61941.1 hypothetical protein ASCRUDRAFT_7400 [Ascoidea rubescens DSM 1968]
MIRASLAKNLVWVSKSGFKSGFQSGFSGNLHWSYRLHYSFSSYSTLNTNSQKEKISGDSVGNKKKNNEKSKTKSHWKLYLFAFAIGIATANYLPIFTIYGNISNKSLPDLNSAEQVAKYNENLKNELKNLKIYQKLIEDKENYLLIDGKNENKNENDTLYQILSEKSKTIELLSIPGGFSIEPVFFINIGDKDSDPKDDSEIICILHCGVKLCGFPGLVHGGILASILDELSINFLNYHFLKESNIKEKVSTKKENLKLSYTFPTVANNFIVIKSKIEKISNKENSKKDKYCVHSKIENSKSRLLVDSSVIYDL